VKRSIGELSVAAEYSINFSRELRLEQVLLLRRAGRISATILVWALEGNHFQRDSLVSDVIDGVIISYFNEED
jgi:hypothetical protein